MWKRHRGACTASRLSEPVTNFDLIHASRSTRVVKHAGTSEFAVKPYTRVRFSRMYRIKQLVLRLFCSQETFLSCTFPAVTLQNQAVAPKSRNEQEQARSNRCCICLAPLITNGEVNYGTKYYKDDGLGAQDFSFVFVIDHNGGHVCGRLETGSLGRLGGVEQPLTYLVGHLRQPHRTRSRLGARLHRGRRCGSALSGRSARASSCLRSCNWRARGTFEPRDEQHVGLALVRNLHLLHTRPVAR